MKFQCPHEFEKVLTECTTKILTRGLLSIRDQSKEYDTHITIITPPDDKWMMHVTFGMTENEMTGIMAQDHFIPLQMKEPFRVLANAINDYGDGRKVPSGPINAPSEYYSETMMDPITDLVMRLEWILIYNDCMWDLKGTTGKKIRSFLAQV